MRSDQTTKLHPRTKDTQRESKKQTRLMRPQKKNNSCVTTGTCLSVLVCVVLWINLVSSVLQKLSSELSFDITPPRTVVKEEAVTAFSQQQQQQQRQHPKEKPVQPRVIRNAKPGEKGISTKIQDMLPNGKIFVEMGANDGVNSNTHWLEQKHGWKGLCIEGGPTNFRKLTANRPECTNIHAFVGGSETTRVFREFPAGPLYGHSGFVDSRSSAEWEKLQREHASPFSQHQDHEIRTSTLANLFSEHRTSSIDFFSLDVEGAEMEILADYPFQDFPVQVWAVESNKLDRKELVSFMEAHGYNCFHYDYINTICEKSRSPTT